jgi:hypothetical protein
MKMSSRELVRVENMAIRGIAILGFDLDRRGKGDRRLKRAASPG